MRPCATASACRRCMPRSTRSMRKISGRLQLELYAIVQDVLVDRLGWFTRNLDPAAGLADTIAHFRAALAELRQALPALLSARAVAHDPRDDGAAEGGGVPEDLAARLALLPTLARAGDVVLIADRTGQSVAEAAKAYLRRLGALRLRPHRRDDRRDRDRRLLRGPGAAEGARQPGDGASRSRAKVIANGSGGRCRGLGSFRGRARRRDGRAGGEDPLRPPPEHGEGDGRREPAFGVGAGLRGRER